VYVRQRLDSEPAQFDPSLRRWHVVAGPFNAAFLVLYCLAFGIASVSVVVPIITTGSVLVVILSRTFLPRLERITWRIGAAAMVVVAGATLTTLFE
jgi:drug/metabolite transporter (DMT)-like permease